MCAEFKINKAYENTWATGKRGLNNSVLIFGEIFLKLKANKIRIFLILSFILFK